MNNFRIKSFLLTSLWVFSLSAHAQNQARLENRSVEIIQKGKFQFKDLNKNKKLDRYEDWRLPVQERVKDLLGQMTLEEKLGFMLISTTVISAAFAHLPRSHLHTRRIIREEIRKLVNRFNTSPADSNPRNSIYPW